MVCNAKQFEMIFNIILPNIIVNFVSPKVQKDGNIITDTSQQVLNGSARENGNTKVADHLTN